MHAIVRFWSDIRAADMIRILDQAERYGIGALWEELGTTEEDGRLWPEVEVEWDHANAAADAWFRSVGIIRAFMEEEA